MHPAAPTSSNRVELLIAAVSLTVVTSCAFARFISSSSFYSDDWADAADRFYTPGGVTVANVISRFHDVFAYRPVLALYVPLKYTLFGTSPALHAIWSATLGLTVAFLLYVLLREYSIERVHALMIGALTLLFPWSDSVRLWASANVQNLSIAFALAGLIAAARGFSTQSWRLHLSAGLLFAASALTYELTLPVIAASGLLHVFTVGWSRAWRRWLCDLVIVAGGVFWVRTHTPRSFSGLDLAWRHALDIAHDGGVLAARAIDPLSTEPHVKIVLGVVILTVAVGVINIWRGVPDAQKWGALAAAGSATAALGWLAFVPADPYYTPGIFGIDNRVNGLAGIGLVIATYTLLGVMASTVLAATGSLPQWTGAAVVAILAGALAVSYAVVLNRHISVWLSATRAQEKVDSALLAAFPSVPPGALVVSSGWWGYESFGVPCLRDHLGSQWASQISVQVCGGVGSPPHREPASCVRSSAGRGVRRFPADHLCCLRKGVSCQCRHRRAGASGQPCRMRRCRRDVSCGSHHKTDLLLVPQAGLIQRLVRFAAVSVTAAVIGQIALVGALYLGNWPARPAMVFSCVVSGVPAYFLNRRWVWRRTGRSHLKGEVTPFWVLTFLGLIISTWLAGIASDFAVKHFESRAAELLLVSAASFAAFGALWILKFAVFNRYVFGSDQPIATETTPANPG